MFNWFNPIWLIENFITCYWFSSDAPAQPSVQTVNQNTIPEYIAPYVQTMLGKAQALTDINQNPYQTYGGQRLAGFSPMQQQAFQNVQNMQTSSQLGDATNMAGIAGLGSLGTAGQMSQAGNNYNQMATNPYATQAFMNPYIQSSLAPQLEEMRRQYGITGTGEMSNATKQGAFGGSREALMASENNRNMNTAMNQTIGQGYNNAFQAAQQAQQFGANLGLQGQQGALSGYGQANQAASNLANIGNTQFGQGQTINADQQKVGAMQQGLAQQGLDMQYQDFLKQQNYPYQQLAFMSDMTRGLPLSQSAQNMYQAQPSTMSQLGGLAATGLGVYGASGGFKGAKKGGAIKEKKYSAGGDIKMMSDNQLMDLQHNPQANPMEIAAAIEQLNLHKRIKDNPEAPAIIGKSEQPKQERSGIGAISTGDMVPVEAAGGGIVAFKTGNKVDSKKPSIKQEASDEGAKLQEEIAKHSAELWGDKPFTKSDLMQKQMADEADADKERMPWDVLTSFGVNTMAGTSPNALANIGQGAQGALKTARESQAGQEAARKLALQQQVEQEKSEFARKSGMLNNMQTSYGQLLNKQLGLEQIAATKANTAAMQKQASDQRIEGLATAAYTQIFNKELGKLNDAQKLIPASLQKSPDQLAAIAQVMAYKQLPDNLKQFYASNAPAAAVPAAKPVPGAAPAAPAAPVASQPMLNKYQLGVGQKQFSPQETQALQWANDPANANNPQSATIRQLLTMGS